MSQRARHVLFLVFALAPMVLFFAEQPQIPYTLSGCSFYALFGTLSVLCIIEVVRGEPRRR